MPKLPTRKAVAAHDACRVLLRLRVALWIPGGDADRKHRASGHLRPFPAECGLQEVWPIALEHALKRDYVIKVDAPRMARQIGLRLKVAVNLPEHVLPPSRVFYWIEEQDASKAVAFAKVAYRRYWLDGRATSDADVAPDAAAALGFERSAVLVGIENANIKDRLIRENEQAIGKGVFGLPLLPR
jgi:2-hydroxychromene-2-carboxylate isomerase